MMILQYQILDTSEEELEVIPKFNQWLCDQIFEYINTKINRRKIQLRLNYMYKVPWIQWKGTKYLDELDIMNYIYKSLKYTEHKDNLFIIETNIDIKIPNTNTCIDRLIRFLEYGDRQIKPINMLSKMEQSFNHSKLNSLWRLFVLNELGYMSQSKIIAR